MLSENNYSMRFVEETDLESLKQFFVKAYGEYAVFQNSGFLNWYFNQESHRNAFMKSCIIAVNDKDEVVSHYGGLRYTLMLHNRPISMAWGVNAYTLPEWRKRGINSKLVIEMARRHDILGTIGMSHDAASFYQGLGFNMFHKQRFCRYVLNMDVKTFEVVKKMQQNSDQAKKLFDVVPYNLSTSSWENENTVIEIRKENFNALTVDFKYDVFATTYRDKNYLQWRFLDHPYIDYQFIASVSQNKMGAYAVSRRERLNPTEHYATRIVDVYGHDNCLSGVIKEVLRRAKKNNDIFVDFCAFGAVHQATFMNLGFTRLQNEEVALLPQVTAPIENRSNDEFIGLFSNKYKNEIEKLTEKDIFFTRADSDRDRIAHINQLQKNAG